MRGKGKQERHRERGQQHKSDLTSLEDIGLRSQILSPPGKRRLIPPPQNLTLCFYHILKDILVYLTGHLLWLGQTKSPFRTTWLSTVYYSTITVLCEVHLDPKKHASIRNICMLYLASPVCCGLSSRPKCLGCWCLDPSSRCRRARWCCERCSAAGDRCDLVGTKKN